MGDLIKSASFFNSIEKEWKQIPIVVRQFVIRASILLAFWFIAYTCILKPNGSLDTWLTKITTEGTAKCLNSFYKEGFVISDQPNKGFIKLAGALYITLQDRFAVSIVAPCNALELFAAYIGFLICVPGTIRRKVTFILSGVFLIFFLNVIRCALLAWINLNKPEWSEFAHHYAFTTIVYVFIFLLWVLFMNKSKTNEA